MNCGCCSREWVVTVFNVKKDEFVLYVSLSSSIPKVGLQILYHNQPEGSFISSVLPLLSYLVTYDMESGIDNKDVCKGVPHYQMVDKMSVRFINQSDQTRNEFTDLVCGTVNVVDIGTVTVRKVQFYYMSFQSMDDESDDVFVSVVVVVKVEEFHSLYFDVTIWD